MFRCSMCFIQQWSLVPFRGLHKRAKRLCLEFREPSHFSNNVVASLENWSLVCYSDVKGIDMVSILIGIKRYRYHHYDNMIVEYHKMCHHIITIIGAAGKTFTHINKLCTSFYSLYIQNFDSARVKAYWFIKTSRLLSMALSLHSWWCFGVWYFFLAMKPGSIQTPT